MKKALKYLALGIVIIVLAFFSLGLIHPSLSYTNTVEVDSTIEEAFVFHTLLTIPKEPYF